MRVGKTNLGLLVCEPSAPGGRFVRAASRNQFEKVPQALFRLRFGGLSLKQIVCLADRPWSPAPGRTQQLLARMKDAQILYFEPPAASSRGGSPLSRQVRPNILACSLPGIPESGKLPGLGRRLFERRLAALIGRILKRHHFTAPLLWTTHPWQATLFDCLPYHGLFYDCSTFWPATLARQEGMLAQAADVVFAASPGLMDHLSPCRGNIALIPNGVNYSMFGRSDVDAPPELSGIAGPVLGWAGQPGIEPDFQPLEYTAAAHPEWTFLLSGLPAAPDTPPCGAFPMSDFSDRFHRPCFRTTSRSPIFACSCFRPTGSSAT
jgi:hypothetical protein